MGPGGRGLGRLPSSKEKPEKARSSCEKYNIARTNRALIRCGGEKVEGLIRARQQAT